jgi:hypothetical protein
VNEPIKKRSNKRKRTGGQYAVRVTAAEREAIEGNAAKCGLTPAAMMRELGCGYEPKSIIDHGHIVAMLQVNGDLARLGNLLKLWLTNSERVKGFKTLQIKQLQNRVERLVDDMDRVVVKIEHSL